MKQREILILAVGIFMTIIAWVVVEIYRTNNIQAEGAVELPKIEKHDIDVSVIDKLRGKTP